MHLIQVKMNVTLESQQKKELLTSIAQLTANTLKKPIKVVSIDPARIYINFSEVCEEFAWRFQNDMAVCPKDS